MPEIAMIVGSLNRDTPYFEPARGVGLSVFGFDPTTGRASLLSEDRSVDNPTFLSVAPASRCVYANSEVFGWHEGLVSAYRYDPAAKRLVYLNKQPSLGSITAHNSLDSEARHLLVVNYGMGAEDEGLIMASWSIRCAPMAGWGRPLRAGRIAGVDIIRTGRNVLIPIVSW